MSRRSLFTLPPVRYEIIPSIREEACAADQGCRICADLCPHSALTSSEDGRMTLIKDKCTGCGACVSVCPREAYEFPGASLPQLQAQVGALLHGSGDSPGHRRILFLCHNAAAALRDSGEPLEGWLPVEVPCLAMVTPGWILQCLNQGAAGVGLLPCPGKECRFGEREELKGRVDYCREFLREIGLPPETVRLFEPGEPLESPSAEPLFPVSGGNGNGAGRAAPRFSPPGAAEAILGLARRCRAPFDLALDHPSSPVGVVEAGEGCTSCGACVSACPANALSLDRENEGITLTFHAISCVGCGECVPVCPEKVMTVEKRTDLSILAQGKRPLHHDTAPRCVNCGEPVAPQAMLDHIASRLGDSPVLSTLRKYCLECRKTKF